jgi:D-amino-acid dehydrogenase
VVVIGGGVVGLSTAYFALKRGWTVTVLERDAPAVEGCSHGNAGLVVPSHFVPLAAPGLILTGLKLMLNPKGAFGFRNLWDLQTLGWALRFIRSANPKQVHRAAPFLRNLNLLSKSLYAELDQALGGFQYTPGGLIMACKTKEKLKAEAELVAEAGRLGLSARLLDREGLKEANPDLEWDCEGGVFFDDDGHLSPNALLARLRQEIVHLGGRISWQTEAVGWETSHGAISAVSTTQGPFPGDRFVLAAGAWTPSLTRDLGLRLPMAAGTGCSFSIPATGRILKVPVVLVEARVAVTPMNEGIRFAGTMEVGRPADSMSPARVEGMKEAIVEALPDFTPQDFEGAPAWFGNRPCPPDGLPYLGCVPQHPHVIVASGHAMMGLSLGPASGLAAVELAAGEKTSVDLTLARPERWG